MIVAVDIGFQQVAYKTEERIFITEVFKRIASKKIGNKILLLADETFMAENIASYISLMARPSANANFFKRKWWYAVQLPSILKKNKVDLLISFDMANTLKSITPQYLIIPDFSYLFQSKPNDKKLHNSLRKANKIITVSAFSKNKVIETLSDMVPPILDLPMAATAQIAITDADKEALKEQFTNGKEYFVYPGPCNDESNLLVLLRAFSLFKQRQQSNMPLLILDKPSTAMFKKLETYKYREDIILLHEEEEAMKIKIAAAAYTMVYPSVYDGYCLPVLQAMQNGVPVIIKPATALAAYAGDAALYTDNNSQQEIADKMMLIYKDEPLRNQLIALGKKRVSQFNWDRTADMFWELIASSMPE
jgi:glycosyltransferase involved in cell wall biosynthesis